jgi:hypothetical protein
MSSSRSNLADAVADPAVGRLVDDLRVALGSLHGDVRVVESSLDLRAEFRGTDICRVVPYREVLHIQVGQDPLWETRLRRTEEFPEVMDRIVRVFLRVLAHGPGTPPSAAS